MSNEIIAALAVFAGFVGFSYLMIYILLKRKDESRYKPRKRSINRGGGTKLKPKKRKKK